MDWPDNKPIIDTVGEWVIYALPHQKKIIQALNKNRERQVNLKLEVMRMMTMDFAEAVNESKKGSHVRRTCWAKDMWMTWFSADKTIGGNQGYLVHTHPYFDHQNSVTPNGKFVYVSENDDAVAQDWEFSLL